MIILTSEHSLKYSAIKFEKVIEEFLETAGEHAKTLKANKEELLRSWRSIVKKGSPNN
jgi:hypothetical protein